ncbi:MAG: LCP family protein [Armatimonadota bacterium]
MGKHVLESEKKSNPWKFLLLCLVAGLILAATGWFYIYSITPKDMRSSFSEAVNFVTNPGQAFFQNKDSVNILCLGLDYNYTPEGIIFSKYARADTIFVININRDGMINILSIPRDTRVDIAGSEYGYDKINTTYALGEKDLAQRTVEDFLGIDIDYYAIIRIKATKELIDAIGGMEVDVEKDIDYDDNWGHTHIHLKKGKQKLNGEEAVGYSRFRYDEEGDRGRIRRQQQVLKALVGEIKNPKNITKINDIIKVTKKNIETNINTTQLIDLARLYRKFSAAKINADRLDGEDVDIEGISFIVPDEEEKRIKINRMFRGIIEYFPREITVNVYNTTDEPGIAHEIANKFYNGGYNVSKIGDYRDIKEDAEPLEESRIIIKKPGRRPAVQMIVNQLGIPLKVYDEPGDGTCADFDILIGEDLAHEQGE